jgi:putative ABC transport system permease protein
VRGLGVALVGAAVPGRDEAASAAVFGYEGGVAGVPAPPPAGEAWVDRRLEADGAVAGRTIRLGRDEPGASVPVEVRGTVAGTSYLLQGGVWVRMSVWRDVLARNRPDQALPRDTTQALVVTTAPGADVQGVQRDIARATDGRLRALTKSEAISAIPGVESQRSTFRGIIWMTLLVTVVVVALFFALLTLERLALYGVLKAIGASSRTLATGLFTQAALTASIAFVAGAVLAFALARVLPEGIPLELLPVRAALTFAGVLAAALLGSAISLRRIIRVDPATAVGGGA